MISRRPIGHIVFANSVLALVCSCQNAGVGRYLHPDFTVVWTPPSQEGGGSGVQPVTPEQACQFAVAQLSERGVEDVVICEARWIAAPLGGYLVDAQGVLTRGEDVYRLFRVGVRDGTEETQGMNKAGEEFVFIALGENNSGETAWFPPPGPDLQPSPGEAVDALLPYEFLMEREQFEALENRYR
jgi:hypothetical protein